MTLYEAIKERKATRSFIKEPLSDKELDEIIVKLNSFELLSPESPVDFRIVSNTKGLFNVIAPHYLIISGRGRKKELENAGFIGEHFVLWLHTKGIGSVWQGKSKDVSDKRSDNDIVAIAFGRSNESIKRELFEFKRKDINKITNLPEDKLMKAVHLAPSGINLQPWYFKSEGKKIVVYRQNIKLPIRLLYKISDIDMGIALSHYSIACKNYNIDFKFDRVIAKSDKKGYKLFGEITYL